MARPNIPPFAVILTLLFAAVALAQTLPALTGRVVDQAELLTPEQEAAIITRLEALERDTSRQLVVVTVPDLQGETVEDFGFRLGETWRVGQEEADNGAILLIAVAERKMRIEVGDGLEAILTDAMSGHIIRTVIRPRFRAEDFPGGISAGVDAIIEQLRAPPELAEERALAAAREGRNRGETLSNLLPLIFWIAVMLFIFIPMIARRVGGRRYRGRRGRRSPIVIWGPGMGGWSGGSSGGGWSGGSFGGGSGGGSFGGFSGGGGSFGGGGASGGW